MSIQFIAIEDEGPTPPERLCGCCRKNPMGGPCHGHTTPATPYCGEEHDCDAPITQDCGPDCLFLWCDECKKEWVKEYLLPEKETKT